MKQPILLLVATLAAVPAFGAEWTYRTKHDSFFNKEERTAVLRSSSGLASHLMIYNDSTGAEFVMLAANKIKCFPTCTVYVKFDDRAPEIFPAQTDRIVAASAIIGNYGSFIEKLNAAKKVTFRISRFDALGDIEFDVDTPFDPEQFNDARELIAIEKRCQDNAVNENFSDCMARLAKKK